MNRGLVVVIALVVLSGASWFLWPVGDETAIRRVLQDLEAGFDAASPRRVVNQFTEDWVDQPTGADRPTLRSVLNLFVRRERDSDSKEFLYSVSVLPESVMVSIESPELATVDAVLLFSRRLKSGKEVDDWRVEVSATMRKDGRWAIAETRWKTLDGSMPFR